MKKSLLTLAVLSAASMVFAGGVELSFSNKLSSDIVCIESVNGDSETDFAGISNKTSVEVLSDKVDAGLTIISNFTTQEKSGSDDKYASFSGSYNFGEDGLSLEYIFDDYYIEYRPIEQVTFGFHDKIPVPGSYLPIFDDNLANGNIGSDFCVVLRPYGGIRLSAGLDFCNFGYEQATLFGTIPEQAVLNFGAAYIVDAFAFGFAARDVINDFGFGVYANLNSVKNVFVDIGYSYNDPKGVEGVAGNFLSLGLTYSRKAADVALDFATNFGSKEYRDFYLATSVDYGVTDAITLNLGCAFVTDFDSDEGDSATTIECGAKYSTGHHEFKANVKVGFEGDKTSVCFPVYWKYTL